MSSVAWVGGPGFSLGHSVRWLGLVSALLDKGAPLGLFSDASNVSWRSSGPIHAPVMLPNALLGQVGRYMWGKGKGE